jgi:3-methylfumaryl-CoA hydratase
MGNGTGLTPEHEPVEFERWIVPEQAEALAGLLGVQDPSTNDGELPPLWHWVYMTPRPSQESLGADGHPRAGIPAPPGPEHVRMFAGGRVTTLVPLQFGRQASATTRLARSVEKQGKSGRLTFTTVRSEIRQNGVVAIIEEQDIVYRKRGSGVGAPAPDSGHIDGAAHAPSEFELDIDPVVLFRFSALTYNAHRIHYDLPYATIHEGYPDLVVHGPLQALVMAEAYRYRPSGSLLGKEFAYRLISPTFGSQRIRVVRAPNDTDDIASLQVFDERGVQTASSTVRSLHGQ